MNYEENLRKIERKLTIKSVRDLGPVPGNAGNGINTYEKAVEMWVKQTMNDSNITATTNDSNSNINKIENPFGINMYTSTDINDSNGTNPFALGLMPNMIRFPAALPALLLPIIFRYVFMYVHYTICLMYAFLLLCMRV